MTSSIRKLAINLRKKAATKSNLSETLGFQKDSKTMTKGLQHLRLVDNEGETDDEGKVDEEEMGGGAETPPFQPPPPLPTNPLCWPVLPDRADFLICPSVLSTLVWLTDINPTVVTPANLNNNHRQDRERSSEHAKDKPINNSSLHQTLKAPTSIYSASNLLNRKQTKNCQEENLDDGSNWG